MDKGLDNHYIKGLRAAESVVLNWQNGVFKNNREAYMQLYNCIQHNDRNIANIYNDKGGSRWVEVLSCQLADGVISPDDLKDFEPEVINAIISTSKD